MPIVNLISVYNEIKDDTKLKFLWSVRHSLTFKSIIEDNYRYSIIKLYFIYRFSILIKCIWLISFFLPFLNVSVAETLKMHLLFKFLSRCSNFLFAFVLLSFCSNLKTKKNAGLCIKKKTFV